MNYSTSTQFFNSRRIGIYEPIHQFSTWADDIKTNGHFLSFSSVISDTDRNPTQSEDTSHGILGYCSNYEHEASKYNEKVQRRLAQNREAARKSRLRKKAYVQQLESSRLKLIQLEQELQQARQQGPPSCGGSTGACHSGTTDTVNSGIAAFEVEYANWVEEQNRQTCELKNALNTQINDVELGILLESGLSHYSELFRMKAKAAKADVFYMISGMFKTPTERISLWLGGFRPSDVLKVLLPHLDDLSDEQLLDIYNLKQSCQQAEDALSQGLDKLQEMLTDAILGAEQSDAPPMSRAMEKLEALVSFIGQGDHLRREVLQQMYRRLTVRQAARGLLVLGEYFQRLRALSSFWDTRHREAG